MSQLSSGGRKTRPKNKKIDKTIVFLIAFAIFAVMVTVICITITLNSKKNGDNSLIDALSHKKSTETAERIKLGDKIWTNALQTETVEYSEGEIVSEYLFSTDYQPHKYEINYEKITGLKNKEVEDKINAEIEEKVFSLKDRINDDPAYDRISITGFVSGNFSDVLSIQISYSLIDIDYDENYESKSYYGTTSLNYRLDTGEKLEFADLFREDTSIKSILSQTLYEAFAWEYAFEKEAFSADFNDIDYGFIENQTFKALAEYNKNPNIDFYFTSSSIWGIIRDFSFEISTKKYCSELALFTKYKSEKLYENSSLQKEFYACTDEFLTDYFEVEGLKTDNFYYEIIAYTDNQEKEESEIAKVVKEKVDSKLAYYLEIANQNPDKVYMASITYYYDDYSDRENHYYNYSGYVSEVDLDYFRNNKNAIIAKARTVVAGDISAYDFSETDDEVEYYEYFSGYAQDYLQEEIDEEVITREEKIQRDLEWEREMAKWNEDYEETDEDVGNVIEIPTIDVGPFSEL